MARDTTASPTRAELEILRILWRRGASTVREVHGDLQGIRNAGYTTVLKLMQIMAEKGLVDRDESQRSHIYSAQVAETDIQTTMTRDLMDRAFGGSASQLVMRALSAQPTSAKELAEIRAFLQSLTEKDS